MKTCLLIDESSVVKKVASRILFQMGFTVDNSGSLEEALAHLGASGMPDLVIVSASLPECPADGAIRTLRALPGGASVVVLASLVEANLGQMTRCKRAGASGFVYRPFDRKAMTGWLKPYMHAEAA